MKAIFRNLMVWILLLGLAVISVPGHSETEKAQAPKEKASDRTDKANEDLKALEKIKSSDILVVPGSYDHVQDVLKAAQIPHTIVRPEELSRIPLDPKQMLMINCPGNGIDEKGIARIKAFVSEGGFLFTTDWALKHVLERAFPGIVQYNNHPTSDDVVRVEVKEKDNLLRFVMTEKSEPLWWLEGSSYPIRILDPKRVKVLITSKEMKSKYGEDPIAILFHYGDGRVFHLTSHFYLQRSELRSQRQKKDATSYVKGELGLNSPKAAPVAPDLQGLSTGGVESAYTAQQFIANVVVERKKSQGKSDSYHLTAKTPLYEKPDTVSRTLESLPEGSKLTVLKREGDWRQVRTASGKEGWIMQAP
ncbi:MAG: SH3 domain-containing protein [Armatimonadetes bacterium]|nr:SH3 domain-containing protein [Armatimonadota bacterium]